MITEAHGTRRIHILPEHLANKIAAGEVIQRPESAVKELVENAIDAQATRIVITVEEGGFALIQVSDNGFGLDQDDAVIAFQRHATSKIASYEDLEAIGTYGFRGEALASIAAVAQVSMKTRQAGDDAGVHVRVEGGGVAKVSREAREPGTTVTVQNLFYNVPARRKFLKTPRTEFRHIYDAVQRAALSHPDLGFLFVDGEETVFSLKPGTLPERMTDLFGQRVMESLIPAEERTEFLSMWGFIGKPSFGQKNRTHQYLFLNRRPIVHRNISHAVFSGYEHLLDKGAFPFFVLFVETDPHRVDVNVHPSKLEAKFDDEQAVYRMAGAMTRRTLSAALAVPGLSMVDGGDSGGIAGLQFTPRQHSGGHEKGSWAFPGVVDARTGEMVFGGEGPVEPGAARLAHGNERPESTAGGLIWQLHNKYILCQIRSGLMIVDQHVAHERVLYEQALARYSSGNRSTQQLLFPFTVTLNQGDFALLQELHEDLSQLGFDIKLFGKNTFVIEGVPPDVKTGSEDRIVQEVLDLYKEYQQHGIPDTRDALAKSFSCRSAIKAGDPLVDSEMRALIDQLFATTMPYVCPHGRPVVLRIPLEELDRRFGRI